MFRNGSGTYAVSACDHYSLLAAIEDLMGVGRLGAAAGARPMADLLGH